MSLPEAVAVLHRIRRPDEVVITSMGSAREWMRLPQQPLDLVHVPSAMGHTSSLAIGLALAQPRRRVIVCVGDGSLLMNLGTLVTAGAAGPGNLAMIVFDNGVYEVTGAQPTPGAGAGRASAEPVDLAGIARAAGLHVVHRAVDLGDWSARARDLLDEPGPSLLVVEVAPVPGAKGPRSPGPAAERAERLMQALRGDR
jgi:thiamine pyrophosphate-dependent acetolactate synthase large subunit-like protein